MNWYRHHYFVQVVYLRLQLLRFELSNIVMSVKYANASKINFLRKRGRSCLSKKVQCYLKKQYRARWTHVVGIKLLYMYRGQIPIARSGTRRGARETCLFRKLTTWVRACLHSIERSTVATRQSANFNDRPPAVPQCVTAYITPGYRECRQRAVEVKTNRAPRAAALRRQAVSSKDQDLTQRSPCLSLGNPARFFHNSHEHMSAELLGDLYLHRIDGRRTCGWRAEPLKPIFLQIGFTTHFIYSPLSHKCNENRRVTPFRVIFSKI